MKNYIDTSISATSLSDELKSAYVFPGFAERKRSKKPNQRQVFQLTTSYL